MGTLSVGVTGGIGTEKTEVCRIFSSLGARVIQADILAKELMERDASLASAIRKEFGNVYTPDGRLVAKALGRIVFDDSEKREILNSLVHPRVLKEITGEIRKLQRSQAAPVVAVEAALLFETGSTNLFDYIIVVESGREQQLDRVMRRDGASKEDVMRRIGAQWPGEAKTDRADFVIHNTGDLESLHHKCTLIYSILSRLSTDHEI